MKTQSWEKGKRIKASKRMKKLWENPDFRQRMVDAHKGKNLVHGMAETKGQTKRIWYQKGVKDGQRQAIEKIRKEVEGIKIENPDEDLDLSKDWDMKTKMVREGYNQAIDDILNILKRMEGEK